MNSTAYETALKLVTLLKEKNASVATAESCTGGAVSAALTSVPGASAVFGLGVASYSCEMKNAVLGVNKATLEEHGAVSRETAKEMAEGVRRLSGAKLGLSVTGVAGPDPSEGHDPGLVYIAAAHPHGTKVSELHITPVNREYVRNEAVISLLNLAVSLTEEVL